MLIHLKLLRFLLFVLIAVPISRSFALPDGTTVYSNIPYGVNERQVMDIYSPSAQSQDAPVIFMVHGGAWRIGDKASKTVVKNKVDHWVSKGFVFISINYRLIPNAYPVEQAEDVKKALRFAQQNLGKWGGSPESIVMMGHSAGAHLVSLIAATPDATLAPWLGTIALDTAAYDVDKIMNANPRRLYKKAFGKEAEYWAEASPTLVINQKIRPFLAVCSSKRKDGSCEEAGRFTEKANTLGARAKLLPVNLSHRNINKKLGKNNCYTQSIDDFLISLSPNIGQLLANKSRRKEKKCSGA